MITTVHPTSVNVGGDAPSVAVRTDATFESKEAAKSFTVHIGLVALNTVWTWLTWATIGPSLI